MRILVVLAHPNVDSFNHAVASRACDTLRAGGHHVDLLDLYALGFRAAMSADERHAYHSEQPMLDPMVAAHAALVKAADALVFIYPTWWSSLPAILKGWLERIMVPGVAFGFNAKGRVRPGLGNVRHLIGISTYGSPRSYVRVVNDNGRRTVHRTLRLNTNLRTRRTWLAMYSADTATAKDRAAFLDRIEQKLGAM
jgi:putative NADPH-quinone reductase